MKKLLLILILLIAFISFSANHAAFFVSLEIFPPVYGIGGSYWWGTDLDFKVPDIGPLVFGTPQAYIGPDVQFVTGNGAFGAKVGVSGQFLLPIDSLNFNLFGSTIQLAFAVNGYADYWLMSYQQYYSESLIDFSISPNIVFMTKPENPGDPRYYGWIWPYPLIIAFGMYR